MMSHVALMGAVMAALLSGCTGSEPAVEQAVSVPNADDAVYGALLARTWPLQLSLAADREPYNAKVWFTLLLKRDYRRALELAGPDGGLVAARMHADLAGLYRQSALAAGNALVNTYGERGRDTDPDGVAHLLAVGHSFNGKLDEARKAHEAMAGVEGDVVLWHAPWAAWLPTATVGTVPVLDGLPTGIAEAAPGSAPGVGELPHYRLREKIEAESFIDMADPASLLQLALWHEAAARNLAGELAPQVDTYGARYRLPLESHVTPSGELPMEFLFGSDYATSDDASFMAAALGDEGLAAIDAYKGKSLMAAIAAASRDADGHIQPERVIDLVASLRAAMLDAQRDANKGQQETVQLRFANVVRTGVLRNLSLLVEEESHAQAHRNSGVLRINAMEYAVEEAGCPAGLMSLAAWDAGNGNPLRATEITHQQIKFYPSLETARYGLGVLASRVSFDGVGMPAN